MPREAPHRRSERLLAKEATRAARSLHKLLVELRDEVVRDDCISTADACEIRGLAAQIVSRIDALQRSYENH